MAPPSTPFQQRRLTRRALLTGTTGLGTAGLALAACSLPIGAPARPAQPSSTAALAATRTPATGGTLRIGRLEDISLVGIPHLLAPANFQISKPIYDTLIDYDDQLVPRRVSGSPLRELDDCCSASC